MFFEDLLQGAAMMNGDYADVEGATKSGFVTVDSRGKSELQPFSFKWMNHSRNAHCCSTV